MGMGNRGGVLPGEKGVMDDLGKTDTVLCLGEYAGAVSAHQLGVTLHNLEISTDGLREISFVDNEEVRLRNAGTAFAGNFVAAGDINDIDGVIREFTTEMGGKVIPTGFEEEDIRVEELMEFLQGKEICGDI